MDKISEKKLLEKAKIPEKNALIMHKFYRGKLQVLPKCQIKDYNDFGIWYSPGVAAPCREIHKNKEKVYEYTSSRFTKEY